MNLKDCQINCMHAIIEPFTLQAWVSFMVLKSPNLNFKILLLYSVI